MRVGKGFRFTFAYTVDDLETVRDYTRSEVTAGTEHEPGGARHRRRERDRRGDRPSPRRGRVRRLHHRPPPRAARRGRRGDRRAPVQADTGDPADAEKAVAAARDAFGRLDVLVCNAGIGLGGTVEEQTPEGWDAVLRTNLTGAFLACRAALPELVRPRARS